MKQDSPGDEGDEPLEENQILRKKIILVQLQKMFSVEYRAWWMNGEWDESGLNNILALSIHPHADEWR